MGAAVPYIAMAAAAALQYHNTEQTAKRQDAASADAIRHQSKIQKEGDAKVNETVDKLATSRAESAREQRLSDYMGVLQRNRAKTTAGLAPAIGGAAFKADAAQAANDASAYADTNAGLMARMDAAGLQRQAEGVDYGRLGTELGLVGRESQGQQFLDQIRLNGIRRNAKMDLAAGLLSAYGSGAASGAAPAGSASSASSFNGATGAGTYLGKGSTATTWPGMAGGWGS